MKRLSDLSILQLENLQLILSLCDDDIKAMSTFRDITEALKNDLDIKIEEFKKLVDKGASRRWNSDPTLTSIPVGTERVDLVNFKDGVI